MDLSQLLPLTFVHLIPIVQAAAANSTDPSVPQPSADATRSVWGILGNCASTLLLCVWHATHFDIDYTKAHWTNKPLAFVVCAIVAPEVLVSSAGKQWWKARGIVKLFREKGYAWSMIHSFFADMGGFLLQTEDGKPRIIDAHEFLRLCEQNKIANPFISSKEIKAMSKTDILGKAVFTLQLFWFTLQAIIRDSHGFVVAPVELGIMSVALLTLIILSFWSGKPLRPESQYTFYHLPPGGERYPKEGLTLQDAWKEELGYFYSLLVDYFSARKSQKSTSETPPAEGEGASLMDADERTVHERNTLAARTDDDLITRCLLCVSWMIHGGLHALAWNYQFPTQLEMILWRTSSLVLIGGPFVVLVFFIFISGFGGRVGVDKNNPGVAFIWAVVLFVCVAARVLLVALTLASLRDLPPSAFQTISWTSYIPHLNIST